MSYEYLPEYPKSGRPLTPVEYTLAELNRLHSQIACRVSQGDSLASVSNQLLQRASFALIEKLVQQMGVIPVIDHCTGQWVASRAPASGGMW